VGACVD
jgi:hypothetical protein